MGLGQLFEIKPRCCRGSLLGDELGLCQFETRNDLTYSFPRAPAGALGRLGSPNLAQAGRYFRGNLWPSAIGRKVMRIVHKPVALAWRQRASSALRARAAATLPCRAFMNNSHDHRINGRRPQIFPEISSCLCKVGRAKSPQSSGRNSGEAAGEIMLCPEPARAEFITEQRSPAASWLDLKQLTEPLEFILASSPLQDREKP
jgi:hypothetical protein